MTRVYYTMKNPATETDDSALVRRLLAFALERDYGITIDGAALAKAPSGKPYLRDHPKLHVSLTHTAAFVACAVSSLPVGIDGETVAERTFPRVAERLFTAAERDFAGDDPRRFFTVWTRKESYAKLTGDGVTKSLAKIDTVIGTGTDGAAFISFDADAGVLTLCLPAPDETHIERIEL